MVPIYYETCVFNFLPLNLRPNMVPFYYETCSFCLATREIYYQLVTVTSLVSYQKTKLLIHMQRRHWHLLDNSLYVFL